MTDADICEQKIRQVAIKAAIEIRKAKGLPEERNVTILYNEVAPVLGLSVLRLTSTQNGDHLPAPHEVLSKDGKNFVIPRKDCPNCQGEKTMVLRPLCQGCRDAEEGKYKTMWACLKCEAKEKSPKAFVQWMDELGVEIPNGATKESLGIKTVTDEGLK